MSQKIIMIAAVSVNNVIGKNNDLVFRIKEDLKHFKHVTENNIVIMGRKTFESMGSKPLPNRVNIILTRKMGDTTSVINLEDQKTTQIFVGNIRTALDTAAHYTDKDIFVIGGSQIYYEFYTCCDEILLTHVNEIVDGDAFFLPTHAIGMFDVEKIRVLQSTPPAIIARYKRKATPSRRIIPKIISIWDYLNTVDFLKENTNYDSKQIKMIIDLDQSGRYHTREGLVTLFNSTGTERIDDSWIKDNFELFNQFVKFTRSIDGICLSDSVKKVLFDLYKDKLHLTNVESV